MFLYIYINYVLKNVSILVHNNVAKLARFFLQVTSFILSKGWSESLTKSRMFSNMHRFGKLDLTNLGSKR